ncbi:MAG: hypothetical protein LBH68_01995 [Bifidobacteriaceae bacterium]|jgi:hypothetical protein|nr:hypothetical protein [Bifidobacteriaceae bacterium]
MNTTEPINTATTPGTSQPYYPAPPHYYNPAGMRPPAPVKTGPRWGAIVWGIILAAIGLWIMAAAGGLMIDGQLAMILFLGLAGLTLIATALVAALRRPKS